MTARGLACVAGATVVCALVLNGQPRAAEPARDDTVVQDLAYGEVLFHFYQEDYFGALIRLLAARARNELPNHAAEAELLLGGLYLSYGQHRVAGEIFERLLEEHDDPAVHDRAWFFLAKVWEQRGYFAEAEAALNRIGGRLPDELEPERRLLHAQVLMDLARFDEARALLEGWNDADGSDDEWAAYAEYNLGVALVRLGRVEDGAAVLDRVGRLELPDGPSRESLEALRDKANVAVGYAWLQAGRPEKAKPSLQRVRLTGAFSNKALLGAGWSDAELEDYRSALTPWLELQERSRLDSAVQEAMLAVPYAFAQLGADGQAADHYLDAIAVFDGEIERVERAIESVRSGRLVETLLAQQTASNPGWYWQLERIPDTAEVRYLHELLSTNRFQEALKSYRDIAALIRNLDRWAVSMGAFDDILDTRQRAYEQRRPMIDASLERLDMDRMAQQRVHLESRLSAIERSRDYVALGTPDQQQLWNDLTAVEAKLALLEDGSGAEELRDKHRFLKGILQWELERDYKARLWTQRKHLRRLDADLKEAQRRRHRVAEARDDWPEKFAAMTAQIESLTPRLGALRERARMALARQHRFIESVAVEELAAQRQRLDTYRLQARFSLAAIYDRAAAARDGGRAAPEAGSPTAAVAVAREPAESDPSAGGARRERRP